jgi:hypothetical protein
MSAEADAPAGHISAVAAAVVGAVDEAVDAAPTFA